MLTNISIGYRIDFKLINNSYQERWRDWPDEAQQPVISQGANSNGIYREIREERPPLLSKRLF